MGSGGNGNGCGGRGGGREIRLRRLSHLRSRREFGDGYGIRKLYSIRP